MAKKRADILLVEQGLADTRSKAAALILAGQALCGDQPVRKAGDLLDEEKVLSLKETACRWVSRGGLKLEKALAVYQPEVKGRIALDVGASTGGFTHVLLDAGAAKVYAVDVGYGQLDWSLRNDPRVMVMEKTNARHLTAEQIPEAPDIVVCDASFISLKKVLPAAMALAKPQAWLIALIKPQFEAERKEIAKGGVVRDPEVHQRICAEIVRWLAEDCGWMVMPVDESPVRGPKGNREFLIAARKPARQEI